MTATEAVFAILLAVLAFTTWDDRRRARRREREQQAARKRVPGCGCAVVSTPDGMHVITCPAHDGEFVSEWEERLSQ